EDGTGTGVDYFATFVENKLAQPIFTALTRAALALVDAGDQTAEEYQMLSDETGQDIDLLRASPMHSHHADPAPPPRELEDIDAAGMESGEIEYEDALDVAEIVDASVAENAGG